VSKLERFHLVRASLWLLLVPIVLLTSLKEAVWFVILLSLYANFAGDISAWQAAREGRRRESHDEIHA
jgi:hypothetical protein